MENKYSLDFILSYKDKYHDLPLIDKKYIIKNQKKKKKRKEIVHNIDNPWLSFENQKIGDLEKVKLTLTSLLNKLSDKTYEKISSEIININIIDEIYLKTLINIIYDKCISEPTFLKLYVGVINKIIKKWATFGENTFITIFIGKCYENYKIWKNVDDNNKMNIINNLILVGELFNSDIIAYELISGCINDLLNDQENKDLSIELLCRLLIIVGNKYEKVNYNELTSCINKLSNKNDITSKNRFLIMDVIDLYNNKWDIIKKENNLEITENTDKLHKQFKNILLEYLDVLDVDEVKEYYIEIQTLNKEDILCNVFINLFIESAQKNKLYLIELLEYLVDNMHISINYFKHNVLKITENKNKIDFPNIEKDIVYFNNIINK